MHFKFGVDSFHLAESFGEKDLWIIQKAKGSWDLNRRFCDFQSVYVSNREGKAELERVGIDCVCTTTLTAETNTDSPDPAVRAELSRAMKKCVDICNALGAPILGGVNYAAWGYITNVAYQRRMENWGVECMREAGEYAKETGNVVICVELRESL